MFSATVGSIDLNSQAFLKVQFTQGGILRSGVSLNGELGGAGGGLTISGTYKYTNAEDTTKTDTGTFTLTRQ